jgi:hypothetical protein
MDIRRHLTFANVASATALTLVLGGGVAVAAGLAPNSVGSPQIKSQAVKSSELKNGGVKGKDVKKDSLTGKQIKESTLGTVPSVRTVLPDARVTAAVGAVPVTVHQSGPFTITLRCVDGGGGNVQGYLEIRSSVDNAAMDSLADTDGDLDVFDGPQSIGESNSIAADLDLVSFSAVSPSDVQLAGHGYVSSKLHGTPGCAAQLTFIG